MKWLIVLLFLGVKNALSQSPQTFLSPTTVCVNDTLLKYDRKNMKKIRFKEGTIFFNSNIDSIQVEDCLRTDSKIYSLNVYTFQNVVLGISYDIEKNIFLCDYSNRDKQTGSNLGLRNIEYKISHIKRGNKFLVICKFTDYDEKIMEEKQVIVNLLIPRSYWY